MGTTTRRRRGLLQRLTILWQRPWQDKWLLLQVLLLLALSRLAINVVPFARLSRHLGTRMAETAADAPPPHLTEARRVAWAIRRVSPYTPWRSNCLPQAVTAKLLLRRQGIPTTLYLGATVKNSGRELEAHAWLRCGPLYVTGGNGHSHFGTLVSFAG